MAATEMAARCRTGAEAIERFIRPATFPLAVRFAKSGDIPEGARHPVRDMGVRITICQAISIARRYGWTVALDGEDLSCPIAAVAFGYRPAVAYYREGHLAQGMYNETLEAGARSEAAVPKAPEGGYGAVVVAPLAKGAFEPQIVLVYANPAQVMRLAAAALWKRGGVLHAVVNPRADCAEELIRTLHEDDYQVILPCYGDRVFGHTQDDEMAFAMPFRLLDELVEGLQGTHKGGVRYPIPDYVQFQARFPATYHELERRFNEGAGNRITTD
ncbi:MAG: DUF169 domain-containing protein [Bacillota bacterium]